MAFLEANSIIVLYLDPLDARAPALPQGFSGICWKLQGLGSCGLGILVP